MKSYDPILVVGLGGIGSHLVEPLARFLSDSESQATLRLADGDTYSRSNLGRQRLGEPHLGRNKAEVQAEILRAAFPTLKIEAVAEYAHPGNVRDLLSEGCCVLSCVDNHASRRLLSEAAKRLREALLISGGNELHEGNVQVHLRERGKDLTRPIEFCHPEIENPMDENPADLSCEELAMLPASAQIIFTNLTAAALMLNAFYCASASGRTDYDEACFDVRRNKVNTIAR